MNVDDRNEHNPEEQDPKPDEPTGREPTGDEPTAEAPTEPLGVGPEAPAGAGPSPPPRRLVRPRSDRVLGGVCAGLGRYFNTDPVFFRIAAIILALIGGAGVLLYIAAVLLVPSEESAGAAGSASPADGRNRGLVIAGVVVLLLIGWPFLLGGGLLFAGILIPIAFLVTAGVLADAC